MFVFTSVALGTGAATAAALLYNYFKGEKTSEELNFEKDLSKIDSMYNISDSCIIKPSLTPNNTAILPKNKVIIKNKI